MFFLQDKPKCWDWTGVIKFMNAKLRWSYTDWERLRDVMSNKM